MTRYTTEPDDTGLTVQLQDVGADRDRLLGAFQECREGRCDCSTDEYDKLESLSVDDQPDAVTVRLDTKPGQTLDLADIDACLRHTVDKAEQGDV
jgi:hypothetical protein